MASDYIAAHVQATTPPPQYTFNAPQGLAVDQWNNVYVADTGNTAVVEIPSNFFLGGATPLLQYPGAPKFVKPVAIAIGPVVGTPGTASSPASPLNQNIQNNYIFVADQGNPARQVVRLPPGGGDLTNGGAQGIVGVSPLTTFSGISGTEYGDSGLVIGTPNGVAVDAAGDVYVSDANGSVWEEPSAFSSINAPAFAIGFTGLSTPAGLAVDPNGNLYVADSGNNRILEMLRSNPAVPFGVVPQDLTYPPGVPGSGVAGTPAGCPGDRKLRALHRRAHRYQYRQPACHSRSVVPGGNLQLRIQGLDHLLRFFAGGADLHHLAHLPAYLRRPGYFQRLGERYPVDRVDRQWGEPRGQAGPLHADSNPGRGSGAGHHRDRHPTACCQLHPGGNGHVHLDR